MNMKLFKSIIILSVMAVLIASCGQSSKVAKAEEKEIPYGFTVVASDFNGSVLTLKHEKTGCYYVYTGHNSTGKAFTQMYVSTGRSAVVPYCE
jgi:hypothetical protein